MKEIKIKTEFIKIDQLLKYCCFAESGGKAKEIIKRGLVKVNGEICTMRGKKIYPGDIVYFEDDSCKII